MMTVSLGVLGLAFVVLVLVKLAWAIDLFRYERTCWTGPRRFWTSGGTWLALFQMTGVALYGWFAILSFRNPHGQTPLPVALLVVAIAGTAALAWFFLPRGDRREEHGICRDG